METIEFEHEINDWLDEVVYLDSNTKKRRELIHDIDKDRTFFFSEPLDFDKDDTHKPARYWLDECEGWNSKWFEPVKKHFTINHGTFRQ